MVRRGTPEGHIKAGCLRYLAKRGITAWNNPSGAVEVRPGQWLRFGRKGSADILGCLPGGRFLAVEVKAPDGRLSTEQRQFLEEIGGLGGLAVMVRDWRELDAALRDAGYAAEGMTLFQCNDTVLQRGEHGQNKTRSFPEKPGTL